MKFKDGLLHIAGGVILILLLVVQAGWVEGTGNMLMYASSWIILLHVFLGEYMLLRHVHTFSQDQLILDLMAFMLFASALLCFRMPSLWCAFLSGVFALAIMKYQLIKSRMKEPYFKRYAHEKICWEMPAVPLAAVLALGFYYLGDKGAVAMGLRIFIFAGVLFFAVWMVGIRRTYHKLAVHVQDGGKAAD